MVPHLEQRIGGTDDFAIDVSRVEIPQQTTPERLKGHDHCSGCGRKDGSGTVREYDASVGFAVGRHEHWQAERGGATT